MPKLLQLRPAAGNVDFDSVVVVPFAELKDNPAAKGVQLQPADKVEDLAPFLPQLSVIALEFPSPGEGRAYSQAKLLRERYGFKGELRAVGAGVKRDPLFFMARVGFDAFELAPGEDEISARKALEKYTIAYQPGAPHASIREQRYATYRSGNLTSVKS